MSKTLKQSILALLVLSVFCVASVANAEVIDYVYDFSTCSTGDIGDNDGWYYIAGYEENVSGIEIKDGGTAPFSGKYADTYISSKVGIGLRRTNDSNYSYSIDLNEDFELSFLTNIGPTSNGINGMFLIGKNGTLAADSSDDDYSNAWGVGTMGNNGNIQWRINAKTWDYHTSISVTDYSIVKLGMSAVYDETSSAYDVTLWYQTDPTDESTRVDYTTVQDVSADMTDYNAISLSSTISSTSAADTPMFDDLTVSVGSVVPEPSTIALLASGLLGLLAYAWRKRK